MNSDTPETDAYQEKDGMAHDHLWRSFARTMERDRNSESRWAAHYKKRRDELQDRINLIENLCTTDHESKETFISRVREILLDNVKGMTRGLAALEPESINQLDG